jgi:hypothetical protein
VTGQKESNTEVEKGVIEADLVLYHVSVITSLQRLAVIFMMTV